MRSLWVHTYEKSLISEPRGQRKPFWNREEEGGEEVVTRPPSMAVSLCEGETVAHGLCKYHAKNTRISLRVEPF